MGLAHRIPRHPVATARRLADLGAYAATSRGTNLRITALDGASFTFGVSVGTLAGATTFTPALSSLTGTVIEWENSAYNVGINNIAYSLAAAVPEPSTYAMFLGGVLAVGLVAQRRRRG